MDIELPKASQASFTLVYAAADSAAQLRQRLTQHGSVGSVVIEPGTTNPEGSQMLSFEPVVFGIGFAPTTQGAP